MSASRVLSGEQRVVLIACCLLIVALALAPVTTIITMIVFVSVFYMV